MIFKRNGKQGRKRLLVRLCLSASGLLVGVLLAEVVLRFCGVSYPLPYMPDQHCGTRLRPGFRAWFTTEGGSLVTINSAGFRDREHTFAKPPNTVRIAVLGDSFAEALQVDLEGTFWHRLEEQLMRRRTFGDRDVEVLNFGVSGFGTAQQLQVLRHYVRPYEPDVILLAFFAGNDLRNNSYQLEPYRVRPFFRVADEQLVLDDSFLRHPDFLKAKSAWIQFKVALINGSRILQVANEWRNRRAEHGAEDEAGLEDRAVFRPPENEVWQEAWDLTERLIVLINVEVQNHNARFWLVAVTHPMQVHPEASQREQFQRRIEAPDLDHPDQRLQELGQKEGFPVVLLAEPMRRAAQKDRVFFHGFRNTALGAGHWNELGHQMAAKLVAEAMVQADPDTEHR